MIPLWSYYDGMHDISFHHFLKKKESAAVEKGSADIKIKFIVAMRIQKDFFFWRRD